MTLKIKNQSTVLFTGYIDGNSKLQFRYGQQELANHGDSVDVIHTGQVQFKLQVPTSLNAHVEHEDDNGTVTWSLVGGSFQHGFPSSMTDPAQAEVVGNGNNNNNAPPHKTLHIKVSPQGGLPDS